MQVVFSYDTEKFAYADEAFQAVIDAYSINLDVDGITLEQTEIYDYDEIDNGEDE